MITLYPSNKLEHLSVLLDAVLAQQPVGIFEPDIILVESPGMQHWVSMQLAQQRKIAMNLSFPLPVRFMWNTARLVLGEDVVPQQSPYRREVLVWRIEKVLDSSGFQATRAFELLRRYWQRIDQPDGQKVQRLQLSTALADVYEQYLLYRPEWLALWEAGQVVSELDELECWQAEIWRELVNEFPLHPARLHQLAIEELNQGDKAHLLPKRIIVFAINTMAPQLIQFLNALAQHTQIHLFHLNPSVNYWGDVQTDKARAKALREAGISRWMEKQQDNPLLGNLGQQGRDLFNLLTELDTFEISAFDTDLPKDTESLGNELAAIQRDILQGQYPIPVDASVERSNVVVAKGHTALREIQGLHDYLIEIMSQNQDIQPQDVVVMCPAIEDYAPVIDAVFQRVGTPVLQSSDMRLPCSIADRTPLDSEPMIAAFVSLLSLPDSRFEVSKIIDYLRLPGLQSKFGLQDDDLENITYWLNKANVHWGLNGRHKSAVTKGASTQDIHSWFWGLQRLLVGMACADEAQIVGDVLTLPDVEGNQVYVLGQLIDLIERLGSYASELDQPRSAAQWHEYLLGMRDECFEPTSENQYAWDAISKATSDLAMHIDEATYEQPLGLRQIREVLTRRFSMPDAGNNFMTGQVTFCSMLPMRSIPFKVVAVLGLNDGEFPRQSTPLSIDLMAQMPRKLGDRSRRLEDRYLFLEALISARRCLYLSYQANSAKDNTERQASLVLQELEALMQEGYQWPNQAYQRQLALHPFSRDAYMGDLASFNKGWFKLANHLLSPESRAAMSSVRLEEPVLAPSYTASAVGRALANPLAFFAKTQLGIDLDFSEEELQDNEPFVADNLSRYQVLDALVSHPEQWSTEISHALMAGQLPDTPLTPKVLEAWQNAAGDLLREGEFDTLNHQRVVWQGDKLAFETDVYTHESTNRTVHVGSQGAKRMIEQWLSHLICCAANDAVGGKAFECYYPKWKQGIHELRKVSVAPMSREEAVSQLANVEQALIAASEQPRLFYADIGLQLVKTGEKLEGDWLSEPAFTGMWRNAVAEKAQTDPYWQWFFANPPALEPSAVNEFVGLYGPVAKQLKDRKQ